MLELAAQKIGTHASELAVGGALYVPAGNPYVPAVQGEDAEKIDEKLDKARQRIGLVSSESDILDALEHARQGKCRFLPVSLERVGRTVRAVVSAPSAEQFGRLLRRVENTLVGLADRLAAGDIEAEAAAHRTRAFGV